MEKVLEEIEIMKKRICDKCQKEIESPYYFKIMRQEPKTEKKNERGWSAKWIYPSIHFADVCLNCCDNFFNPRIKVEKIKGGNKMDEQAILNLKIGKLEQEKKNWSLN